MPESRMTVGNVEILSLNDGDLALPLADTFPGVPAAAWGPYQERYPGAFSGAGNLNVHLECYLLRSQGVTILVDTGLGGAASNPHGVEAMAGGVEGRLLDELSAAGVDPGEIDTVFLSHLHFDHVGWNLIHDAGETARPTFPNARYLAHEADWEAFQRPDVQANFPPNWNETLAPLPELGLLDLLSGERALTGEITAIPTPGHTPGSMSLAVESGGQRAYILGDVFHGPAQITETEWKFSFDMDADQAVATRQRIIDRAESEDAVLAICHHGGFGRVTRVEGRRYWRLA
jgi:glyoxylase-like metal-dependent hydrolase (beta-lactamase superfamily II)